MEKDYIFFSLLSSTFFDWLDTILITLLQKEKIVYTFFLTVYRLNGRIATLHIFFLISKFFIAGI